MLTRRSFLGLPAILGAQHIPANVLPAPEVEQIHAQVVVVKPTPEAYIVLLDRRWHTQQEFDDMLAAFNHVGAVGSILWSDGPDKVRVIKVQSQTEPKIPEHQEAR